MGTAIDKAIADSQRSYVMAKAAVADAANDILASSRGGLPLNRYGAMNAADQYQHLRGWVYAAVRPIAQTIAGQGIKVGVRLRGYHLREMPDHPLALLLADPNDLLTSWGMLFSLVASMECTGKGFWWVTTIDGRKQILPIPVSWVIGFEGTTSYSKWLIRPPGSAKDYPIDAAEMVYVPYPDPSDPHGALSPLQAAAAAVEADEHLQIAQRDAFRRGLLPTHALIVGKHASPDGTAANGIRPQLTGAQRRQLVRAIRHVWRDTSTNGDPLILDGLIEDVKRLTSTPQEMDFLQSGKATKARIFQSFGVNEIIAGQVEGANRASSTEAMRHFATFCVNPKIQLISECLTEWFRPMFATGRTGQELVVWIPPVVVKDDELEIRRLQLLMQAGAITPDEMRAAFGYSPLKGGLGSFPAQPPQTLEEAINRQIDVATMASIGHYRTLDPHIYDAPAKSNGKGREAASV